MTVLDFKALCTGCHNETTGRLHFNGRMSLVDTDGGMLFNDGWRCHNCLRQPWASSDLVLEP